MAARVADQRSQEAVRQDIQTGTQAKTGILRPNKHHHHVVHKICCTVRSQRVVLLHKKYAIVMPVRVQPEERRFSVPLHEEAPLGQMQARNDKGKLILGRLHKEEEA